MSNTNEARTWMVRVDFAGPHDADTATMSEEMIDALGLDVATSAQGRVGTSMFVDGPGTALQAALEVVERVGGYLGAGWAPVDVHVLTGAEFEVEQARPVYPKMAGIAETAEIMGVSSQRASQLYREGRLPTPIAQLASGPVFLEAAVRAFAEQPRRAGRPKASA